MRDQHTVYNSNVTLIVNPHDNCNAIVLTLLTHLTCLYGYNLLRNAPRQSVSVSMINTRFKFYVNNIISL